METYIEYTPVRIAVLFQELLTPPNKVLQRTAWSRSQNACALPMGYTLAVLFMGVAAAKNNH
jgi:hypothetical protein